MQQSVDRFCDACDNLVRTISIKKTEVMRQPAPGKPYVFEPNITVNDQWLNAMDKLTHLESTLSRNVMTDDEVNARLDKASVAFGRLYKNLWDRERSPQRRRSKSTAQWFSFFCCTAVKRGPSTRGTPVN